MSICVISQPRFFPGLHYLHRMMMADVFVVFDSVQYNPRHEENRAKLKTPRGDQWLTVPMRQSRREDIIRDIRIDNSQTWQAKAINTLQHLYCKAPFYKDYAPMIYQVLEQQFDTLTALDRASWEPALRLLGITCRFVLASELPVAGKGPQLLLDMCKHLGATTYLSGMFGREYLNKADFERQGIEVRFHEFTFRAYRQCYDGFSPYLSYLDTLFNAGLDRALVLDSGSMVAA